MGTEIKRIVLSPIRVSGRFMKRIQDFLVIIQRLYIGKPVLLNGKKKETLARAVGSVALIFLRMDVLLEQDQEEALTVKENKAFINFILLLIKKL